MKTVNAANSHHCIEYAALRNRPGASGSCNTTGVNPWLVASALDRLTYPLIIGPGHCCAKAGKRTDAIWPLGKSAPGRCSSVGRNTPTC